MSDQNSTTDVTDHYDAQIIMASYGGLNDWPDRGSEYADLATARWDDGHQNVALDYDRQEGWWKVTLNGQLVHGNYFVTADRAWDAAVAHARELGLPLAVACGVTRLLPSDGTKFYA